MIALSTSDPLCTALPTPNPQLSGTGAQGKVFGLCELV